MVHTSPRLLYSVLKEAITVFFTVSSAEPPKPVMCSNKATNFAVHVSDTFLSPS